MKRTFITLILFIFISSILFGSNLDLANNNFEFSLDYDFSNSGIVKFSDSKIDINLNDFSFVDKPLVLEGSISNYDLIEIPGSNGIFSKEFYTSYLVRSASSFDIYVTGTPFTNLGKEIKKTCYVSYKVTFEGGDAELVYTAPSTSDVGPIKILSVQTFPSDFYVAGSSVKTVITTEPIDVNDYEFEILNTTLTISIVIN